MIITLSGFSSHLKSQRKVNHKQPPHMHTHTEICMHTFGCEGFVNTAEQGGEKKQIIMRRRRRRKLTRDEVSGKVIIAV